MPAVKTEQCTELNRKLDHARFRLDGFTNEVGGISGLHDLDDSKLLKESVELNIIYLANYLKGCELPYQAGDRVRAENLSGYNQTVEVIGIDYPNVRIKITDQSMDNVGEEVIVSCDKLGEV